MRKNESDTENQFDLLFQKDEPIVPKTRGRAGEGRVGDCQLDFSRVSKNEE
jgi:hypothetical protein